MKCITFHLYNFLFLSDLLDETVRSPKTESMFNSFRALNKLIIVSYVEKVPDTYSLADNG